MNRTARPGGVRRFLLALAVACTVGAVTARAQAVGTHRVGGASWEEPMSDLEVIHDLDASAHSDRLLAVRELNRRLRAAIRQSERSRGELTRREAEIQRIDLITELVGPARTAVLSHPDIRRPLCGLLARSGDPTAVPELRAALAEEERKGVRRRITWAIDVLEGR